MLCKIVSPSNEIYKLSTFPSTFQELLDTIRTRLGEGSLNNMLVKYMDADNELVTLNSDEDLQTAVLSNKAEQIKTLKVFVLPQKSLQTCPVNIGSMKRTEKTGENVKPPVSPKEVVQRVKSSSIGNERPEAAKLKKSLTNTELSTLDGLIGLKIQRAVEENVKSLLPDLMAKLQGQNEANLYDNENMNILAQSMPNVNKLIMSEKKIRKGNEEDICHECLQQIQDVKYSCLHCPDFKCCEDCENKIEHAHPLLKIKISLHSKPAKSAHGKIQYKFNMNISPEKAKKLNEDGVYLKKSIYKASGKVLYAGKISFDNTSDKSVKVHPLEKYQVTIKAKNTGKETWPEDVKLCCVNGIYRNQEQRLLPLEPGMKQSITLDLEAPPQHGKYLSQWKLYYNEEDKQKSFGQSLFLEIQVDRNGFNENNLKNSMTNEARLSFPKNRSLNLVYSSDENEKNETVDGVSGKRLKVATYLNEIFPGRLQEKLDFVNKYSDNEVQDMSKIVELYLINLSKVATRRGCKCEEGYSQPPQMSITLS